MYITNRRYSKRPTSLNKNVEVLTTATYQYIDSITIPANCYYTITLQPHWSGTRPMGVALSISQNNVNAISFQDQEGATVLHNNVSCTYSGYTSIEKTFYAYGKWSTSGLTNKFTIDGFYIPA